MITEPGIYPGVSEATYHADADLAEQFGPSLSVTGAKTILKSPARFRYEQTHPVRKRAFDLGHAAHAKVLGVGMEVTTVPADLCAKNGAWSTSDAKAYIAEVEAAGKVVLKADEIAAVDAMALELGAHPVVSQLFAEGNPEQSFYWQDPETLVTLRGRTDWRTTWRGRPLIVDYKTTGDADPNEWRWDAGRYGYHQQDCWYREGLDHLTGEQHGFVFVVQETKPPHLVSVCEIDDDAREIGTQRNRVARRIFLDCMTRDEWPGYAPVIHPVAIPNARYAPETQETHAA